ncbi:hypothetical protein V491_05409 [Pseudogymnoascus sp. VKM F-3775]|nr:hypothetical protein V491_05409 [Pseudogymnoascus sp. VKM F-3775]
MDPFERLPAELINRILLCTSDFVGIESLLIASHRVHAIFHGRPGLLFQELVASNAIASATPIQEIIQKVQLLHSPSFNVHGVDEYIQCTNGVHHQHNIHSYDTEVLEMVRISAQIQRLACKCLSTMQQNFISVVSGLPAGSLPGSTRAEKAAKPFSWVEVSNVYWALWHLRHYSDLHKYASRQNWSEDSMKRLEEYHTWNSIDYLNAEIIATVAAVLADLGFSPIYSYPYQGEDEESLQGVWWYPMETPPPLFLSFDLERSIDITVWPSPPTPQSDSTTEAWHLSPGYCGKAPSQMALYKDWARVLAYQGPNPNYTLLRIQPYRRLGVLVWDAWRMYSTGLMQWNNGEQIETPDRGLTDVQHVALKEWHSRWIALAGNTC